VREDGQGTVRAGRSERDGARIQNYTGGGIAATLDASYYKGSGARNGKEREFLAVEVNQAQRKYIVRRLTPLECVRLQGYPDDWLDGVDGSDSAKYKALGNSLAIPCAFDVMNRIARFVESEDN
jgi:site-specific DNA-cytosine methylase